jgi:hypothetical protein
MEEMVIYKGLFIIKNYMEYYFLHHIILLVIIYN